MNERGIITFIAAMLVVVGLVAVGSTVFFVARVDAEFRHAQQSHATALSQAFRMNNDVDVAVQEGFAYVLSGDVDEKHDAEAALARLKPQLAGYHAHAGHGDHHHGARHEIRERLDADMARIGPAFDALFAEYETTGQVSSATFEHFEAMIDDLTRTLDEVVSLEEADVEQALAASAQVVSTAQWLAIGQAILMVLVLLIGGLVASRALSRVFESRERAVRDIRLHRQAIESSPVGVTFADAQHPALPLVYANAAFEEMTGWSTDTSADGQPSEVTDSLMHAVRAALADGQPRSRVRAKRPDGSVFWADITVSPVFGADGTLLRHVAMVQDITDRLDLEARLLQAQKMESVGQLAGGVAHDFNNYLTVINGNAELLADGLTVGAAELGREILAAGRRSADLTAQLLAFARKQRLELRVHDLTTIVGSILPLLGKTVREDVVLVADLAAHPVTASVDRSQIEQIVTNLVLNARDAMPDGGTVTIRTCMTQAPHPDDAATPRSWATLCVIDTGTGVHDAVLETLFEPFVTTKGPSSGTGLGLSTVYGVAQQSGGWVDMDTERGRGTTFWVHFPAVDAGVTDAAAASASATSFVGSGTVLLVEDDALVRPFVSKALEGLGFDVVEAADGVEGLSILRERPDVRMLMTDVTMPNMGGFELAEAARSLHPEMRVLFMSGYAQQGIEAQGVADPSGHALLRKPFTVAELQTIVAQVFETASA